VELAPVLCQGALGPREAVTGMSSRAVGRGALQPPDAGVGARGRRAANSVGDSSRPEILLNRDDLPLPVPPARATTVVVGREPQTVARAEQQLPRLGDPCGVDAAGTQLNRSGRARRDGHQDHDRAVSRRSSYLASSGDLKVVRCLVSRVAAASSGMPAPSRNLHVPERLLVEEHADAGPADRCAPCLRCCAATRRRAAREAAAPAVIRLRLPCRSRRRGTRAGPRRRSPTRTPHRTTRPWRPDRLVTPSVRMSSTMWSCQAAIARLARLTSSSEGRPRPVVAARRFT